MLTVGCYMALGLWSGLNSTYICPLVVGQTRTVPLMQWLSAGLDTFLAIAAYELSFPLGPAGNNSRGRGALIWGPILIVSGESAVFYFFVLTISRQPRPSGPSLASSCTLPNQNIGSGSSRLRFSLPLHTSFPSCGKHFSFRFSALPQLML